MSTKRQRDRKLLDAADRGELDTVKRLLDEGVDVNCRSAAGWTPLHNAAMFGHVNVCVLLLSRGADCSLKNNHGYTALDYAEGKKHSEVVKVLNSQGNPSTATTTVSTISKATSRVDDIDHNDEDDTDNTSSVLAAPKTKKKTEQPHQQVEKRLPEAVHKANSAKRKADEDTEDIEDDDTAHMAKKKALVQELMTLGIESTDAAVYVKQFRKHGFDSIETLQHLSVEDLTDKMDVKLSHAKLIFKTFPTHSQAAQGVAVPKADGSDKTALQNYSQADVCTMLQTLFPNFNTSLVKDNGLDGKVFWEILTSPNGFQDIVKDLELKRTQIVRLKQHLEATFSLSEDLFVSTTK